MKTMPKKTAVKEYLANFLKYSKQAIEELEIVSTQVSKGVKNTLYVTLESESMVKAIYKRASLVRNPDIKITNKIPSKIYDRYISLQQICKTEREQDPNLRTQVGIGQDDLLLYKKNIGERFYKRCPLPSNIPQPNVASLMSRFLLTWMTKIFLQVFHLTQRI